ncbi:hypothetical protein [Xanthomonas oryzae]|uniref:hypothetical protein n=1 Tax=Xanthomonas oryzae TaxID=347 RepID=UPI000643A30D|nr:hypothetical protein [Xanthomonas oryzae]
MTRRRPPTASASARPTRTRARPSPPKRVQWVVVEPDRANLPPMLPPDPDASPQGPGTLGQLLMEVLPPVETPARARSVRR